MHDFLTGWKEFLADLYKQVKNGTRYAIALVLVGVAIGLVAGLAIRAADWSKGTPPDLCPCPDRELVKDLSPRQQENIRKLYGKWRSTPPADTAGARSSSSSVKDTASN